MSTLRFAAALAATNLRAALALRGAFWMQVVFMFLNNLIFFSFWWLAFQRIEHVGGWRLPELCALYGLVAGAFGASVVFLGGLRDLARAVVDGELDVWLTQPKPVLLQAAAGRCQASGFGDMASAVLLLWWSGYLAGWGWVLAPLAMLCGALVLAATTALIHSVAFWAGPMEGLARQATEWVVTTTVYPASIYSGTVRFLMFVVLPSAFVSQLPVELLRDFSWPVAGGVVLGTAAYVALALAVFARGLRVYTSGNRFVQRA